MVCAIIKSFRIHTISIARDVTIIVKEKQRIINPKAALLFFGRIIPLWYPIVAKPAKSMVIDPNILEIPNVSGVYIRVIIGINNKPRT